MLKIVSRAEAKEQKLPRFYTGQPCVNGHTVERFTSSGACIICARINQRRWNSKSVERIRGYGRKHYQNNRETRVEAARLYRQNNPDAANAATRKWRQKNKEVMLAHNSKRRARMLQAMPPWLDTKDFVSIYADASRISKETGIPHHVDHIVPLVNKWVCGLHVPWNLQIIPAKENQRKNNRFDLDLHV
jgi:hypothetical protein